MEKCKQRMAAVFYFSYFILHKIWKGVKIREAQYTHFLKKGRDSMPEEQAVGGVAAIISSLLPLILIIAVFYFMIIRPQRKREKENREMLASLKVGDNVTTIGGICGKITAIRDDILTVEVGTDKVKLAFERWAIRSVDKPISDDD